MRLAVAPRRRPAALPRSSDIVHRRNRNRSVRNGSPLTSIRPKYLQCLGGHFRTGSIATNYGNFQRLAHGRRPLKNYPVFARHDHVSGEASPPRASCQFPGSRSVLCSSDRPAEEKVAGRIGGIPHLVSPISGRAGTVCGIVTSKTRLVHPVQHLLTGTQNADSNSPPANSQPPRKLGHLTRNR